MSPSEHEQLIQFLGPRFEAMDRPGRREILERDLAMLRGNVAVLRARIDELERRLRSG
jgi:hypothetical protein